MSTLATIALGSNLGDRRATLDQAILLMDAHDGICVQTVSSFIETDPVGVETQGRYLNGAVMVETSLPPHELLEAVQGIEAQLGRDRSKEQRWGPRTCDLDILFYGDLVLDEPDLAIPHPRISERAFVLVPLAEIAPEFVHPVLNKTADDMIADLEATS
jgi:2-amino-4-hydroxy-6-hydroxymethyldihydropteridine diphosphokinase